MTKRRSSKRVGAKAHDCSHDRHSEGNDRFLQLLEIKGFRKSKKREAVLRLLSRVPRPLSVEEILKELRQVRIDRVSLYRMLTAFEETQLIFCHDLGDRIKRFELSHEGHHHHHIVCRRCRRVDRLPDCKFGELQPAIQQYGYSAVTHSLEFFGICATCS